MLETIWWGCFGGLLPDVLRIISARHDGMPDYLGKRFFWVSVVLLVALGGFAVWLLHPSGNIEAVAIGFSAPEIISKTFGSKDEVATTRSDSSQSSMASHAAELRRWWAS